MSLPRAQSGKAFIVFYEETCAHCKKLLPAWDKLGAEYYGVKDVIIGKVDCKKEWKKDTIFAEAAQDLDNKALCEKYNPTTTHRGAHCQLLLMDKRIHTHKHTPKQLSLNATTKTSVSFTQITARLYPMGDFFSSINSYIW